jgi:hypothetical protein
MRTEGRLAGAVMSRCLPRRWTDKSRGRHFRHGAGSDGSEGTRRLPVEPPPGGELSEQLDEALHELLEHGTAVEDRWKASRADARLSAQAVGLLSEWVAALRNASLGMERALLDTDIGDTASAGPDSFAARSVAKG